MGANEASKWRPIYRNVQLDEKCKVNTGRGEEGRARRGCSGGGGGGCNRGRGEGLLSGQGGGRGGEGEGGRSLSQAELRPAHNRVAKSTRRGSAHYLPGSTRRGPATPLGPALLIDVVTRGG